FDVKPDGTIGKGRVFFDASPLAKAGKKGAPDGMKVDRAGNLFATGPGGVLVLTPEGKHLGTIATGVATANCGWGDDGTVLYVTVDVFVFVLLASHRRTHILGWAWAAAVTVGPLAIPGPMLVAVVAPEFKLRGLIR